MKRSIRILTLCLGLLMLLTAFAACNNGNGKNSDTTASNETKDPNSNEKVYEKFDGYVFNVMTEISDYQTHEFDSDEAPAGTVYSAIFERNAFIEQELDVKIVEHQVEHADRDTIIVRMDAGEREYDLVFGMGNWWFYTLLGKGYLTDMGTLDNMDLSASCWDQNSVSDLSVLHKNYAVTGDLHCAALDCTSMLLLNRELLAKYPDLQDPSDLVLNDTWTYEEYMTMVEMVTDDWNSDEVMDEKDQYGITTTTAFYTNLVISSGEQFFAKNSDDVPTLAMSTTLQQKFDKILTYAYNDFSFIRNTKQGENPEPYRKVFNDGRALFMGGIMGDLGHADLLASGLKEVSPIPFPKFDTEQDRYYTPVNFQAELMMMPVGKDTDTVGYITQIMCEESTGTIRKQYYEQILKSRRTSDPRDPEILDTIYESRSYDLGQISEKGDVRANFNNMCEKGNGTIASFIQMYGNTANRLIKELYNDLAEKLK